MIKIVKYNITVFFSILSIFFYLSIRPLPIFLAVHIYLLVTLECGTIFISEKPDIMILKKEFSVQVFKSYDFFIFMTPNLFLMLFAKT